MAYEVLARKYRSRDFGEIVGQGAIATTLKNAIEMGRIHHGYLFTGTRGVGKTSMARILAKALNCHNSDGPTATPCSECESCLRIADGSDLDVVEIDAASNTGVDNIRELRSNAAFRPARSRFKVYIIDEVHMLSSGAFNALLKTLEEPPEHVKFILATTETHKVPATIQSRCQRFDFRSISPADIGEQLQSILEREGITADPIVVRRVSRAANGSMRDALSLLDQLLAYGASNLTAETIEDVLPGGHDETLAALVDAIAQHDAAKALECVDRSLISGYTPERFCESFIEYARTLMILSICGGETELIDLAGPQREQLNAQARSFDAATYVYMIGLLEETRRRVKSSSAPRPLIDAVAVRMALTESFVDVGEAIEKLDQGETPGRGQQASLSKKKVAPRETESPISTPDISSRRELPDRSVPRISVPDRSIPDRSVPVRDEPTPVAEESQDEPVKSPRRAERRVGTISAETKRKMSQHPLIRQALEQSGGTLINVQKLQAPTED
ncbi:MAG: DNA polymerase III subunit gamma/tau [Phycisphaerales bacterium]|nr:DNA polymerase III subunit gamma/tau [Phycisphaerales bacterium]